MASKFFNDLAYVFDEYIGKSLLLNHPESQNDLDRKEKKQNAKSAKKDDEEKPTAKKETTKASEKKHKKKDKDPNAPKKPLTAFMLYTNNRRPIIKKENPSKFIPFIV